MSTRLLDLALYDAQGIRECCWYYWADCGNSCNSDQQAFVAVALFIQPSLPLRFGLLPPQGLKKSKLLLFKMTIHMVLTGSRMSVGPGSSSSMVDELPAPPVSEWMSSSDNTQSANASRRVPPPLSKGCEPAFYPCKAMGVPILYRHLPTFTNH